MTSFNVLSLFDGISCGQMALQRAGIPVSLYFASEVKKYAMKATHQNYPETVFIGDVRKVFYKDGVLTTERGTFNVTIDLLLGGSPCQNFSFLNSYQDKEKYGLKGDESSLFYEYLRILNETKPKYFLLENVRMKKESEAELNAHLGVEGAHINSNLVSAQNRHRIYWSNIYFDMPQDKHVVLESILETDESRLDAARVTKSPSRDKMFYGGKCKNITRETKSSCLTTKQDRWNNAGLLEYKDYCRFLTPTECERLQTVSDGYTAGLSVAQRYDVLGDGWTVDVVAHILSYIKDAI